MLGSLHKDENSQENINRGIRQALIYTLHVCDNNLPVRLRNNSNNN